MTSYYNYEEQCKQPGSDFAAADLIDSLAACGYSPDSLGGTSRFVGELSKEWTAVLHWTNDSCNMLIPAWLIWVAIGSDLFDPSMCGAEVTITHNGQPFSFSEGPIFVGDSCGGCTGGSLIDLSGKIALEMMGACKNPPSLSYTVGTNIVGAPVGGTLSGGNGTSVTSSSANSQSSSAAIAPFVSTSSTETVNQPAGQSTQSANLAATSVKPATQFSSNSITDIASQTAANATQPDTITATAVAPASSSNVTNSVAVPSGGRWTGWSRPPALFAEKDTATNGTACKRRRRRGRLDKAH
ncbi:uncharacterized protein I206_103764 [Kwoniella pini CBS 10737]|uniref:Uncharacterized protein n=1 Tax=Kwoniella pini CBS 10737 TaxID=1296096 RepID=A0A1B9HSI9_9TREE|nr:uncharacterized protein I206_07713 [Kwoniella pini CBS 10737]OCF46236.1 hypothetical protein I206_07713 [Kwoniella pini CBS 10737]